jgi:hypothetical protein
MATFRDIDYNTRINGSLNVSQASVYLSDLDVQGVLAAGDITDVNAAIKSKLSSSGGTITGDITVEGSLSVSGGITGVDLSLYYTKTEMQTSGSSLLHWANITDVPSGTTAQTGIVRLSSSTTSTSELYAATSKAVKTAYDLASSKWTYNEGTIQAVKVNSAMNADTVNNLTVLTAVPLNAKFTETTINGKTGAISKADIVALGIPAQDTVYVHPGTHSADMIVDGTTNKAYTATERTKLENIAEGANNYSLEVHDRSKHSDIDQSLLTTDKVQFGQIGVGTATPEEALDVVGNIRVREENSVKFGGSGSSDAAFEIKYNSGTNSIDFNFL